MMSLDPAPPPDVLDKRELEAFLKQKLPESTAVNPDDRLLKTIELTVQKQFLWIREGDSPSKTARKDLEDWRYQRYFSVRNSDEMREVGTTLADILKAVNSNGINTAFHDSYSFDNYVIVTKKYILMISLPEGPVTW